MQRICREVCDRCGDYRLTRGGDVLNVWCKKTNRYLRSIRVGKVDDVDLKRWREEWNLKTPFILSVMEKWKAVWHDDDWARVPDECPFFLEHVVGRQ